MRHTILALALTGSACTWETDLPAAARAIAIDPDRELVVTDLSGPLVRSDGPLGFRSSVERLGLENDAMLRWLEGWSSGLGPDRGRSFDTLVTCTWLKARPANECDETCGACAARELDLAAAPLRLIAVVNRTDLSVMPDRAGEGGEGRLVFAVTRGAADDPASAPLPLTVIFEYAQPGPAIEWARRWHTLGSGSSDHLARLGELTASFGSIAQIRTADAATGPMVFHEFAIDGGHIVARNVRNTPDWGHLSEPDVRAYARTQAAALREGTALMPESWWAASSALDAELPPWIATVDEHDAIVRGTCGGCHQQATGGFQIDPLREGRARMSNFLVDPSRPRDEVRRRIEWMQLTLSR